MKVPTDYTPYDEKENPKPYIFVCYSHLDQHEVVDDLDLLHSHGFRIWYDKNIVANEEWEKAIETRILCCQLFVIFVSGRALESEHVRAELSIALKNKNDRGILSIFLEDVRAKLRYERLRERQGVDKFNCVQPAESRDYRLEILRKLTTLAPETREDPIERDSKILGLGYLPTFEDVLCRDPKSLTSDEKEARRTQIVLEMRIGGNSITSYHIENVFQLTSESTEALQKLEKLELLKTDPETPTNLLSLPLHIDQTYVAPLRLVRGLITRLDENWPPIVASYSILVKRDQKNQLEDLHYYIEFCWLAWGPSVLTTSPMADDQDFIVVQAAFGDEANSLPLIMKKRKWALIESALKKRDGGWPVSLENVLIVKPGVDDFFKAVRGYPLFEDVFSDGTHIALYLPYEDEPYLDGKIETRDEAKDAYYSTAYVWLMLEQIEPDQIRSEGIEPGALKPGKVIPFFEHANLATTKGLDFLQHCLARKAIYHVLDCDSDPDYRKNGYYRFATALFPDRMIEILEKEVNRLSAKDQEILSSRLQMSRNPEHWRTPVEVVEFADAVAEAIKECCRVPTKKPEAL